MLSENIGALRDQLARFQEDGVTLAPEAVETFTRMLATMRADAAALESGILARAPLPATLRLAEKLTRQGVRLGAGEQPLLSRELQQIAETIAELRDDEASALYDGLVRVMARINEASAWAWALEERAARGEADPAEAPDTPGTAPASNVVCLFDEARRST